MTLFTKPLAMSCAVLLLSATAGFAQVGGGDIPASAKAKGGTTSSMMPKSSMKSRSMMNSKGTMMRSKHNMMRSHGMMMHSGGRMSGHKTF